MSTTIGIPQHLFFLNSTGHCHSPLAASPSLLDRTHIHFISYSWPAVHSLFPFRSFSFMQYVQTQFTSKF